MDKLHRAIQNVMGWTNSHLHSFNAGGGVKYSYPYPDYDMDNNFELIIKIQRVYSVFDNE